MTQFKDTIFQENVAIHCPEEWMANELLKYADSRGYRWNTRESYTKHNFWRSSYSIYYISKGGVGSTYDILLNHKLLHYNDVAIKEENNMKISPDYELIIKGRIARVGSELWYKTDKWVENIFITGIFIGKSKRRINYSSKNKTGVIDIDIASECLFWEKPIIYQLPDTEGNLSEVKVGQPVWVRYSQDKYKAIINKFYGELIGIKFIDDGGLVYISNIKGLTRSEGVTTTNKPKRDFSKCMDWNQAPNGYYFWAVNKNGMAFWYIDKPNQLSVSWDSNKFYVYKSAGFRQNLINPATGFVDDWKDSLVERPKKAK